MTIYWESEMCKYSQDQKEMNKNKIAWQAGWFYG